MQIIQILVNWIEENQNSSLFIILFFAFISTQQKFSCFLKKRLEVIENVTIAFCNGASTLTFSLTFVSVKNEHFRTVLNCAVHQTKRTGSVIQRKFWNKTSKSGTVVKLEIDIKSFKLWCTSLVYLHPMKNDSNLRQFREHLPQVASKDSPSTEKVMQSFSQLFHIKFSTNFQSQKWKAIPSFKF